jgi:hypothetical protein
LKNKRYLFIYLLILFAFFSAKGIGKRAIDCEIKTTINAFEGTLKSSDPETGMQISAIASGIYFSMKINENNYPGFHNFNKGRKYFLQNSFSDIFLSSDFSYVSYCHERFKRLKITPFYISYRKLII